MESFVFLGLGLLGALVLLILVASAFFTVPQQTVAIVERFGKFLTTASPGLNFRIPLVDSIKGHVSLKIQQLNIDVETKTKDDVFVKTAVSVQFYIIEAKVADAFYKLSNAKEQISSYIFDIVRAEVPKLTLDEVFAKKDNIATAISEELKEQMESFGYGILKSLVTDVDPDAKVKSAMNEINASTRLRLAAAEKAEANKIALVKAAEAEAESKELQGKGIAAQRKAIVSGLNESVADFMEGIPGSTAQDVMNLVLLTQYFDTLKDIGATSKCNTIFVPHSPSGMSDIASQVRNAFLQADAGKLSPLADALKISTDTSKKA